MIEATKTLAPAGAHPHVQAPIPSVDNSRILALLPLAGYIAFAGKGMIGGLDPVWAGLLFALAATVAGAVWWLTRNGAGARWLLDALDRHAAHVVLGLLVVVAGAFIVLNVIQARYFLAPHAEDTAYYSQVLWNTLHGDLLAGNVQQERLFNPPVSNDLALHVSGVLLLVLLPAYALIPHFLTLLVLRDVALAAAAWPLFLVARERLGGTAGVAAAALYLANATVMAQGFQQFTLLQLAPLPFFYALRAFVREEYRSFLICLVLTILTREDAAIAMAGFGVWALLGRRRITWSAAALLIPVAWWGLVTLVIQPAFGRWGNNAVEIAFAGGQPAPLGPYQVFLGHPAWILAQLRDGGLLYFYEMLRPIGFVAVLGVEGLLAAPSLAANVVMERMFYAAGDPLSRLALLPACALVGATVVIVCRLGRRRLHPDTRVFALTMLLLLPSVNLIDGVKDAVREVLLGQIKGHDAAALWEAVARIPDGAAVAAPVEVLPALSRRRRLFTLQHLRQYAQPDMDYVLLDRKVDRVWRNPEQREDYVDLLARFSRSSEFATVWQREDYVLLRRTDAATQARPRV